MELDDILETSTLPPVQVDVDQALERTSRLGRAHRRRRRGLLGLGAATAAAVIALALVAVDGDESANVATGPDPETLVPADPEPGDAAVWVTDHSQRPASEDSTFTALVSRLGCNSGVTGEVLRPGVRFSATRVVVTFTVTADRDGGDCPSNDQVPFEVQLGQPLGERTLFDGACTEGGAAMSTSFCDPDGVRWEPPVPIDEPTDSGATPEAHECVAAEGSQIDVAHEPNWRPYAEYAPWTDRDGCLLRIDVFADRPMPDHCGWGSARVLITGSPIGTPYSTADESVHYVRDPDGVLERPGLTESLDLHATVPPEAVDTGYRLGDVEVWHIPGDESFVWVISPEGVEKWPSGETPVCN